MRLPRRNRWCLVSTARGVGHGTWRPSVDVLPALRGCLCTEQRRSQVSPVDDAPWGLQDQPRSRGHVLGASGATADQASTRHLRGLFLSTR